MGKVTERHSAVFPKERHSTGAPGWLSQLNIRFLLSAQVVISGLWDLSPTLNSTLVMVPARDSLSPSPFAPSLFLKKEKDIIQLFFSVENELYQIIVKNKTI